ncbi:hypothetical protein [Nostoc sp.]|uniref:hypothetical protein n=1 Tax=Nostoc sp. TaxID=1180 RepID=UPI002FF599C6
MFINHLAIRNPAPDASPVGDAARTSRQDASRQSPQVGKPAHALAWLHKLFLPGRTKKAS